MRRKLFWQVYDHPKGQITKEKRQKQKERKKEKSRRDNLTFQIYVQFHALVVRGTFLAYKRDTEKDRSVTKISWNLNFFFLFCFVVVVKEQNKNNKNKKQKRNNKTSSLSTATTLNCIFMTR